MDLKNSNKIFGGEQRVYTHQSSVCSCEMTFAVFVPPGKGPFPALFWLSGLTCTEENFTVKAGAQRKAAELGMIIIAPDTSPRGEGVPDDTDGAYDLGLGAGFYVNATQQPWAKHYQMRDYIEQELYALAIAELPINGSKVGIAGHSMGGHGALTIGMRNPEKFMSISAFAPIVSPLNCPWGEKALTAYLGKDRSAWRAYDACAMIEDGARPSALFIDQGLADDFLATQLRPELLQTVCTEVGIDLIYRGQSGYDHSFYFIATFIDDHLTWHWAQLA